jgi:hypothetical protein
MRHYFQSQNIAFRVKEIQKEYKDVFLMDPLTHLPNEKKKGLKWVLSCFKV